MVVGGRGSQLRRLFVERVHSIRTRQVVWTLFVLASSLWALSFLRRPVHELTPTLTMTGGLLVLMLVVYLLPPALVPSTAKVEEADRLKAAGDVRTALVQALGGAALVGTLYFSAASLQANNRTLDLNRQGQVADRFTRAVAQLGDAASLDVRVGGIYALEQVARDATEYRTPVLEVLTSYLREHDRWQAPMPSPQPDATAGPPQVRADVQAVVTALRQREPDSSSPMHLHEVDLRGADLTGAHLERADLTGAHLEQADLPGAHLEQADLTGAHLEGAVLNGAHLEGAVLNGAHLEGAYLIDAHLEGAYLFGAHLEQAHLDGAHLEGADRRGAHLDRADLSNAHLEGAESRTGVRPRR